MSKLIFVVLLVHVANSLAFNSVKKDVYNYKYPDFSGIHDTEELKDVINSNSYAISDGKLNTDGSYSLLTDINNKNKIPKGLEKPDSDKKILKKRDLNIPGLPSPNLPKLPTSLPTLPSSEALPKIPSVGLPEIPDIPKIELPDVSNLPKVDTSKLPKVSLPDLPEIPNVDLPKIPDISNKKLYEPHNFKSQNPLKRTGRYLTKRQLSLPELPTGLPKLPELPGIPTLEMPQLPNIPLPEMPKLPHISKIASLNRDESSPFYDSLRFPKYISPEKNKSQRRKRSAIRAPYLKTEKDYNNYLDSLRRQGGKLPFNSFLGMDQNNLISGQPAGLVPLPSPKTTQKAARKNNLRNCDEGKATYKETTKITIHNKGSDESLPNSSEESLFSKTLPKSLNPDLSFRPLLSNQDTWSETRKPRTGSRHDECVEEVIYEDQTGIFFSESDESSKKQLIKSRRKELESVIDLPQWYQLGELNLKIDEYRAADSKTSDDKTYVVNKKTGNTEEIGIIEGIVRFELKSDNSDVTAKEWAYLNAKERSIMIKEETMVKEVYEDNSPNKNCLKADTSEDKIKIIEDDTLIKGNEEERESNIEDNDEDKREKREVRIDGNDETTKLMDEQKDEDESKPKFRNLLLFQSSLEDINSVRNAKETGKRLEAHKNHFEKDKHENNLKISQVTADSRTKYLKAFFRALKERVKLSDSNIETKINEQFFTDENLVEDINERDKRSTEEFNEDMVLSQMINVDPLINERVLKSSETGDNYIDRDKRKAAADDNLEEGEDFVVVTDEESLDAMSKKSITKKEAQKIDESDSSAETSGTTSTTTTTSTSTTSATSSSTSEFDGEEETTEYDYDLEEDACPTDFFGTAMTKVRCVFNSITSKVIGIEFGPSCC